VGQDPVRGPWTRNFEYRLVGDTVVIRHHGRRATTLRGVSAREFLAEVEDDDPQEFMDLRPNSDCLDLTTSVW
jgi:hypothetical protein